MPLLPPTESASVPPMPQTPLRQRLREALTPAMKARDRAAVAALRSALSALENAEAIKPDSGTEGSLAIEQLPIGAGATEADRRVLTPAEVTAIVRDEIAERETAADEYDRMGQLERAEGLRAEAAVLQAHLTLA
jgi:uncharacterized protein YqeY